MPEELPVRYCHGCKTYDDHPRVFDIANADDPASDKLYHVDCSPDHLIVDNEHNQVMLAHRESGNRGDDLRASFGEYARSIQEEPAHENQGA